MNRSNMTIRLESFSCNDNGRFAELRMTRPEWGATTRALQRFGMGQSYDGCETAWDGRQTRDIVAVLQRALEYKPPKVKAAKVAKPRKPLDMGGVFAFEGRPTYNGPAPLTGEERASATRLCDWLRAHGSRGFSISRTPV